MKNSSSQRLTDPSEVLGNELGICLKNKDFLVLSQNEKCRSICGQRLATVCKDGCLDKSRLTPSVLSQDEGAEVLASVNLHGGSDAYDVVILSSGERVTTLLFPLKQKHSRLMAKLKAKGLSPRECEVMKLALDRISNASIAKRLFISRSTVRTHLNNIYKKLLPEGGSHIRSPQKQLELLERGPLLRLSDMDS